MSVQTPIHVRGLLAYLSKPQEAANEDLALSYFRATFGGTFTRQKEAKRADGYVAGSFVLELKGRTGDWLAGLFQALAYKNEGLDFAQIVVAAKDFLAVWQVTDIPEEMRVQVAAEHTAPNAIGRLLAKQHASQKNALLKLAVWNDGAALSAPLFREQADIVLAKVAAFEATLKAGRKIRQRITVKNFPTLLKEMTTFFPGDQPLKAVRAFYSMLYAWDENSALQISNRVPDQATLGGELVTDLIPAMRSQFKEFVEARYIALGANQSYDDFFARYDAALDAVDSEFRRTHGIFFTDLDLSKFVMWMAGQEVPELGHDYLVIDPACGSGNLVTNWRSPLELRHKVVSEIEPELLFAVEKRMKGDSWHNGKFTVVPKVSENRGLNFLDCSAKEYIEHLRVALAEKGHVPDKPLAFLCNPPYRSDDDQAAGSISYQVHPSILEVTGIDGGNERYSCFLAQMKLVCDAAASSGLPGDSLLLLLTKSAWLTQRSIFQEIRTHMLASFEDVGGVLVNGNEFFDVKSSWPVAFTIWKYRGIDAKLDPYRSVELLDLTWMRRQQLAEVPWGDRAATQAACQQLLDRPESKRVRFGQFRTSIREWSGLTMTDFKRDRRKNERDQAVAGGLPLRDRRHANKKVYGESDGSFVGFMDDLTPCRVKKGSPGKPWFRLNNQFMDAKKNRCFSGPPTHLGYCATDLTSAKKLFFWYATARTFLQRPYPMWADADDLWQPKIPLGLEHATYSTAFAIAFSENECLETYFPANNPALGAQELFVPNPMTPLDDQSFWTTVLRPYIGREAPPEAQMLVAAVEDVFKTWRALLGANQELPIAYSKPYFADARALTAGAGIQQIKDYANETAHQELLAKVANVQARLRGAKDKFFALLTASDGLNYFDQATDVTRLHIPEVTSFEKVLCRRLALAGLLVRDLHNDASFGRTKLSKLFYLADARTQLRLETNYVREAAGPLDQRAIYNERIGVEAMAAKYGLFERETRGRMVRYKPLPGLDGIDAFAARHLKNQANEVLRLSALFRGLSTDQAEIIATLFACWNDLLLRQESATVAAVVAEFLNHWHPKKGRFAPERLVKALEWMHEHDLVPSGRGELTLAKAERDEVVDA
ncbi:MAG: hypothetical protein JWM33_2879 [Caulobacteraceae bacterium]|nr:hypothetical protein [Caulobacteraceae bacterium]